MRHRVFGRKLNRDIKERKALFKNLIIALITHGSIQTTVARAKAITRLVDKLVIRAKEGSNSALRQLSSFLNRQDTINKLTSDIAPRFKSRIGGYLKMIRVGKRKGDNTEEVILKWSLEDKGEEKKTTQERVMMKEIQSDQSESKKATKI